MIVSRQRGQSMSDADEVPCTNDSVPAERAVHRGDDRYFWTVFWAKYKKGLHYNGFGCKVSIVWILESELSQLTFVLKRKLWQRKLI